MSGTVSTRRAILRARHTGPLSGLLALELLVVAAVVGLVSWSWPVAIVTFVGLSAGLAVPVLSTVIVGALSLAWCVALVQLGHALWGWAGVISLGVFGALVVAPLHFAGLEGLLDASR